MSEPRSERCETCRFWSDQDVVASGLGDCHRYPPVMALNQRRPWPNEEPYDKTWETRRPQDGGWPMTFPYDWCGEWRAKDAPPTEDGWRGIRIVDTELGLPSSLGRATVLRKSLRRLGAETLGQLADLSAEQLCEVKNFGEGSLLAVRSLLARHGAKLRGD